MATLAKLTVKLITDVNEFTKGMDTAVNKMAKVGKSMADVGDKMTLGVTLPILAAGGAAIKFASDLDETRNKATVVFGSMSDDVLAWGKTTIDTMGLSENSALNYASTFGSIIKNMGMTEAETAAMSKALTQLTIDYSSFHNLSPDETFEKIRAGLVGSSEPLLSLGKDLRVAAVNAFALENGIATAGSELNNQQVTLARYGALLAQSTDEMGDFARTSDGLANLSRTFKELTEDTLAKFGLELLPIATDFMKATLPILQFFNGLPAPVKSSIISLLLFTAAIGPVLSGGGRLLQAGKALKGVLGTAGLGGSLSTLITSLGGTAGTLGTAAASFAAAAAPVIALVGAVLLLGYVLYRFGPQAWETVKMLATISEAIRKRVVYELAQIGYRIGTWIRDTLVGLKNRFGDFQSIGKYLMGGFIAGVKSMAVEMINSVLAPIKMAIDAVRSFTDMHSNSRLTTKMGAFLSGGFAAGITLGIPAVVTAGTSMAVAGSRAVAGGVSGVSPRGGGGVVLQFSDGAFRFDGDISDERMEKIKEFIKKIFGEEIVDLLES